MKEFFQRYVTHNFGLKVLSLLLATGLWLALARDPVAEVAVEVPIVFRNVPDNLVIAYENLPKAEITLRGPDRAVRAVEPANVHAEIDLTGETLGEHTFPSSALRIHQPHDLEVVSIAPDKLHISLVTLVKPPAGPSPSGPHP